jgi:hypothetical protein
MYHVPAKRSVSTAGRSDAAARAPDAERAQRIPAAAPHSARHALARISVGPRVLQRVQKQGPGEQGLIDVTEVENYLPNCVDNLDPTRTMYRRTAGITSGWNDTDLFYADGDGALVQITTAMVNAYWNPKYDGFAQASGPDWTVNCEDYAKAGGIGAKAGDYVSTATLSALIRDNGNYVLELSFHWMRVAKTGADAITIRQKDGESAVYTKDFALEAGLTYILNKRSDGGTVYAG